MIDYETFCEIKRLHNQACEGHEEPHETRVSRTVL